MKFSIQREVLLKPLQQVIGAVERRNTMAALSNILFRTTKDRITLTATDMEVELMAGIDVAVGETGETTLPARKLLDICKALPEEAQLTLFADGERGQVMSGRSRFTLSTLPASEFPVLDEISVSRDFVIPERVLKALIQRTAFAMANQDVRYYLNGLMLEVAKGAVKAVATDGHRLSYCQRAVPELEVEVPQQVIIPRKGVQELLRLLSDVETEARVQFGSNHLRISLPDLRFTTKLIDGRFPDYDRVIPRDGDKTIVMERETLRRALARASILSNEKYKGVRLLLDKGTLGIQAHNPEQEKAEEELEVDYNGDSVDIGFNVSYLIEVLDAVSGSQIKLTLKDTNASALLQDPENEEALYVVMPMRL